VTELKTARPYHFYQMASLAALVILTCTAVNSAMASNKWQSHEELAQTVYDYVSNKLKGPPNSYTINLNPIDTRLKLIRCEQAIEAFGPMNRQMSDRMTVGVRCAGAKPWKVYIPVQITRFGYIIVAKRPLIRGQILDSNSIVRTRFKISGARQAYIYENKHALGKMLIRAINAGTPIKVNNLRAATIVKRGQEVILIAITASIQVRMGGKALADGAKGDLIRVRNLKTKKVVEGIVTKAGTVKVIM